MGERLLALRGATTCDEDSLAEIDTKTQVLVQAMLDRNEVDHEDIVSIIFTATDDLTSQFPATAARALGLGDVPLICARELGIDGGMPRAIRVRTSRRTGWPIASHMRRTCRFRPSWITISIAA